MNYDKLLSEHKALETELTAQWCKPQLEAEFKVKISPDWTGVDISFLGTGIVVFFNRKQDHAGFYFMIDTWFGWFNFNIYDTRHWNYDNDTWEVYDKTA